MFQTPFLTTLKSWIIQQQKVIWLLGISLEEVMVIGDGLNDISLFEMFYHIVAVDNAVAPIKKLAKYHIALASYVVKSVKKYVL